MSAVWGRLGGRWHGLCFALLSLGAGVLALTVIGWPHVTYDTAWQVAYGSRMAHGHLPDFGAGNATQHPLEVLVSAAVVSVSGRPTGSATPAETLWLITAATSTISIGLLAGAIGRLWGGWPTAIIAAVLVWTRLFIVSTGAYGFIDSLYCALVLGALFVQLTRPEGRFAVPALLAVAGTIRPEAWLFSLFYFAWVTRLAGRVRWSALAIAMVAPGIWMGLDLLVTGSPLHSFTSTTSLAADLDRDRGPVDLVLKGPVRFTQLLNPEVTVVAVAGLIFALRSRVAVVRQTLAALGLALLAFALLSCVGFSILSRYLLLPGCLACVAAAYLIASLPLLARNSPTSRFLVWAAPVGIGVAILLLSLPKRLDELRDLAPDERGTAAIESIREDVAAAREPCLPLMSPTFDIEPYLSIDQRRRIERRFAPEGAGTLIVPRHPGLWLDNAGYKLSDAIPPRLHLRRTLAEWRVYTACGHD